MSENEIYLVTYLGVYFLLLTLVMIYFGYMEIRDKLNSQSRGNLLLIAYALFLWPLFIMAGLVIGFVYALVEMFLAIGRRIGDRYKKEAEDE